MCRVKAKVVDGPIEAEKVAYIENVFGEMCEVFVGASQVAGGTVEVTEVDREGDNVLVELPRESTRGDWRLWVRSGQLIAG